MIRWGRVTTPCLVAVVVLLAASVGTAQSPDRVKLTERGEVQGEIVSLSPNDVEVLDARTEETVRVPIDRVREVVFGAEPDSLRSARTMLLRQDPAGALAELDKVEQAELDGSADNVLTEMDFVRAAGTARAATATGSGLDAAEKAIREFVAKRPRSHHFYAAHEILGDLLARAGKYDAAAAAYAVLEKGPPALRVRAAAAKAGLLFEQKQYAAAQKEYGSAAAIDTDPKDATSAAQKRYAELGAARCLVRQGKPADVVPLVRGVVAAASPDDRELLARAFNVLGDAYAAVGGKEQDALIAYLTVDLVFNTVPDSHAEALFNLARLWQKAQNPERSRAAKQALETSYPDSRWNRQLATGASGG
jgi:tetratricopeptide (TPR) repeat protein